MANKKTLYQKLVMNCEEVTMLSTKMVSGEKVSLLQRLRLWYHNMTCPPCGHFHADNQKMQDMLNGKVNGATNAVLSEESKEKMEVKIKELN